MKKAVITGAAGFAGYSTTIELLNSGYEVYAVLRPNSEHNERLSYHTDNIHLIELDCSDFGKIPMVVDSECDVFIHLAWFGGRDDFSVQTDNIGYCLSALESAAALKCKRFIGIGSQAEYGLCDSLISEDTKTAPINAYGAAKLAALYLSKRRAEQLGVEWIWGRIFSLYGDKEPSGRLFPDLINSLRTDRAINLSSCEQNWDYLNVKDGAKAIVALAEKGHPGEIYNIANGDYRSLKSFVEEARDLLNSKSDIEYGPKADPFVSLQPDVSKIYNHTGWKPDISFREGVLNFE